MAFDPEAKLSDVLAGGYHLNAKLQALLDRPLDNRGQEEAKAFSLELSRVFTVSMSMLQPDNSNTVGRVKIAPEIIRTGSTFCVSTPAKDKRNKSDNGEHVTPFKKSREVEVTRKEITPTPHRDGYQWRKYGQKNIQNCNFARYYYRCNRDRGCEAKKKVQQQDSSGSGSGDTPMFEVTYVNGHTCHVRRANDDTARIPSPWTANYHALGAVDSARNGASFDHLFPSIGGGSGSAAGAGAEENEAMVSCLAKVISGTTPSPSPWPPAEASPIDPSAYVPPLQTERSPSLDGSVVDGAMPMMTIGTGFPWDPSSFCPVEEEAGQLIDHCDLHMDAARFVDTVWPQYTCGAWR